MLETSWGSAVWIIFSIPLDLGSYFLRDIEISNPLLFHSIMIFDLPQPLFSFACIKSLFHIGASLGLRYTCPNHLNYLSQFVLNWYYLHLFTNNFISYSIVSCITTHPSHHSHFVNTHLMYILFSNYLTLCTIKHNGLYGYPITFFFNFICIL